MKELFYMAQSLINLEEKLNTLFDNPIDVHANFRRSIRNDSHRRKDEFDRGVHGQYDKHTPLNASHEKIYQEYANIWF